MPKKEKGDSATFEFGRYEKHSKVVQFRQLDDDGEMYEKRGDGEVSPVYISKEVFGDRLPKSITLTVEW